MQHIICLILVSLSMMFTSTLTMAENIDNNTIRKQALSTIGLIPATMPMASHDTKKQIELGEKLYFETALSINQKQSCNSCHNILAGGHGVDGLPVSIGTLGSVGKRNAPSTWNAGFQFAQNWDTSAQSLEEQAHKPLLDPNEMAMQSEAQILTRLESYRSAFEEAYTETKDPLSLQNVMHALAAFQRTLITRDRFDQFLRGDDNALSKIEKEGFIAFQKNGCLSCHSGPLMGGQFAMKMGLVIPYPNTEDKGLGALTGRPSHNYLFKVPILRNVANTAPYFHDGKGKTLEEAVFLTGWHQLGKKMSEQEVKQITAFLKSLDNVQAYVQ
ncbi:cytochrome-c peroxidase [Agaribacter flavus]|uniref:Cytochrome-c peroxidase n=1 Tax=Agaribacter flavus TaxID=1902781 RepID=A0ABV7FQY4_9ALTE